MRGLPDGEAQAEAEYARLVQDLRDAAAAATKAAAAA